MRTAPADRNKRRKQRAKLRPEQLDIVQALADESADKLVRVLQTPGFDFESFDDFIWDHRLYNLAYELLDDERLRVCLPAWLIQFLQADRTANAARQSHLLNCLMDIDQQLTAAGIDFRLLKGFAMSAQCYPASIRRYQHDIDLLVRPNQVVKAVQTMERVGFRRPSVRLPLHQYEYQLRGREVSVDLHWMVRSHPAYRVNERALWKDPTEVQINDRPMKTLSYEYSLVLLLLSIAHDIELGAARAKHFVDLYLLIVKRADRVDWQRFLKRRDEEDIGRLCVVILTMFCHLFRPNPQLAELSSCLAVQSPESCINQQETWELLQNPRDCTRNRLWLRQLLPVTRADKIRWYFRTRLLYVRYYPRGIPAVVFRKLRRLTDKLTTVAF